jgi:uncharacterized protein
MNIFITGGTGFVGRNLTNALIQKGHRVTLLTRSSRGAESALKGVLVVQGNPVESGGWQSAAREQDVIINLAGASIFSRWTEKTKALLRESRLLTTRNLLAALNGGNVKAFISTSAVGYYGFREDEILTEDSPPGQDFLAQLAKDWEKEAWQAQEKGTRVVITRFGIVLGEKGGALGQMIPLFKRYIGGPIGNGRQWFSWIHMIDLVRAYLFLLDHPEISGPVNFTSPNPIRNRELAKALGQIMNRPSILPTPGFMLKLALGEFGSVLLKGQRVIPKKLVQSGFSFEYPEIHRALENIIRSSG